MTEVFAEPLSALRARTSAKWRVYPPEVLPLFVAEMDYPLAEPISEALVAAIRRSDTGYIYSVPELPEAFARFSLERWGWQAETSQVWTTTDVSVAIVETLRGFLSPGDGVVICPPIYPPFFELIPEAGCAVIEVPLQRHDLTWSLDLDALESAFAAGAHAMLLCNPHNPVGLPHSRDTLVALAELAARYDVLIVSDEIHAPMPMPGAIVTPFLSVSDAARAHGVCVTAASKAFNLAGLKCALIVTSDERRARVIATLPEEVVVRTGILGYIATIAAYAESGEWLDSVIRRIDENRLLLGELLAERLPAARYSPPQASYLAWIDLTRQGWGDDPSVAALARGVALNPGPSFGHQGAGFARLNLACSPEVLDEAIGRLAR